MLNEAQQRRVWEGMLSAEIRANYFAELSGQYRRRQRGAMWIVLFLSSGAAVSLLYGGLPVEIAQWLRPAFSLLTVAVSLYSVVAENQKFSVDGADLHSRWNKLASAYEDLWENVYADDAAERLKQLGEEGAVLSKTGTAFPYRKKDMLKWQQHVEQHHLAHASR
jgi:hypothetical protein